MSPPFHQTRVFFYSAAAAPTPYLSRPRFPPRHFAVSNARNAPRPRATHTEQDYNNAVDVWSLGCILAELLSMQKESFATSQERNALFPGKSCFPLSAEKPSSYSDALDQLNVIFDVIGTPSREDIKDLVRLTVVGAAVTAVVDVATTVVAAAAAPCAAACTF